MHENLQRNLRAVFSGENPIVVSDSQQLVDWLRSCDVHAVTFHQLLNQGFDEPVKTLLVPIEWEQLPSRSLLRKALAQARVLWLPQASFSSDLDTAKYAVQRLADVDIVQAVALNRRVATRLLMSSEQVTFSGPDTALTVQLPQETLQVLCRTRLELLPDEHAAMGNYFEVGMSPTELSADVDTGLLASGTFRIDAVIVGKHREMNKELQQSFAKANAIANSIRQACPIQISIKDNQIVKGLEPWIHDLTEVVGSNYASLTEIAVGTGLLPRDKIDWNRNSILNEGAAGIHIGIGNTLTSMHFDFIAIDAQLDGLYRTSIDAPNTTQLIDSIHLQEEKGREGAIIIDDRTMTTMQVNKAARVIIQALEQPKTHEELAMLLAHAANCSTEEAMIPVQQLLNQIQTLGWTKQGIKQSQI